MANPTKVSWTPPTLNNDGSAISAGEITGYQLGYRKGVLGDAGAGVYTILPPADPPTATTDLISDIPGGLAAGTYCVAGMTLAAAGNSPWSAEVQFTIAPVPLAPTGFTVA